MKKSGGKGEVSSSLLLSKDLPSVSMEGNTRSSVKAAVKTTKKMKKMTVMMTRPLTAETGRTDNSVDLAHFFSDNDPLDLANKVLDTRDEALILTLIPFNLRFRFCFHKQTNKSEKTFHLQQGRRTKRKKENEKGGKNQDGSRVAVVKVTALGVSAEEGLTRVETVLVEEGQVVGDGLPADCD